MRYTDATKGCISVASESNYFFKKAKDDTAHPYNLALRQIDLWVGGHTGHFGHSLSRTDTRSLN
jgi:hypothetical protein